MKRLINEVLLDTDKAKKIARSVESVDTLYIQKTNTTWYENDLYFLASDTEGVDPMILVLGGTHDGEFHKTRSLVLNWIGDNFINDELIKVLKKSGFYEGLRTKK
tara:strand:+ start:981 stop:1295 length:315 start_codon:yes stop_codon:yes gene_type:complete